MQRTILRFLFALIGVLSFAQSVYASNQSGGDGMGCGGLILFIVLVGGLLLGGLMWGAEALFGKPKKVTYKGYDKFYASLPGTYGYIYFNDNTGYAINMLENKIYLYSGSSKIYDISDIRDVKRVWQIPGKVTQIGKSTISSTLQTHGHNVNLEKEAYNQSGLFISVADIEKPQYHIKFVSESDLLRSYEIFLQAMEGKLPQDREA